MKKKIVTLLIATMVAASLVGCGAANTPSPAPTPDNTITEPDDGELIEDVDETVSDDGVISDTPEDSGTNQSSDTLGAALINEFNALAESTESSLDIANALIESESFVYAGATAEVEPGYLMGFTEEISGFDDGVMFAPMIGSIPFVGYVFTVSNDAEGFLEVLKETADPRWNICTEADETVYTINGDKVCFIMCSNEE